MSTTRETNRNYEEIASPYNTYLQRTTNDIISSATTAPVVESGNASSDQYAGSMSPNGNVNTQPVKSGGSMGDIWTQSFIRSINWKPKTVGFYIDGLSGYAEFTNVYVSGNIQALTGNIGGFTIGATDLSVTKDGNTTTLSSGNNAFIAGPTNAPTVRITQSGILNATNAIISGTISATTGSIGGFSIASNTLSANGLILDSINQRISLGTGNNIVILDADDATYRIWIGNATASSAPFSVTKTGVLNATGATISGTITASAGAIGGFSIGSDYIRDAANSFGLASTVTGGDDVRFWAGDTFVNRATAPFRLTESGVLVATSATITGTITATSGTIGGFTLSSTALYAGSGVTRIALDTSNGIFLGANSFSSAPFRVALDGTLIATNADITGSISATSGTIGGTTITATTLYGGIIQTAATVGTGHNGVIMDSAGLRGYDSVLGNTFNLPTNGDAPSFSSGVIENTIFEVNTNAVIRTSSTVGDGTSSSAGILINDTGLYATEANQLLADANVKILVDGSATIKMNIKGGQTDYNTGIGYFIGYSGSDYKLSIGDPSANSLTWDGAHLRMTGYIEVGVGGMINNATYLVSALPVPASSLGFYAPSSYK